MPRLIFKCPYIQGGSKKAAAHLSNYVRYMATREGAQRLPEQTAQLPATEKQRQMVERLLRDFPLSRGTFEYEDYAAAPTRGNASEFISRALEDNYDRAAKKENYIQYIAGRPHAQRTGAHALFTGSDESLTLSQVAEEVAHHPGSVWLPILSLRREDAARLGYDDAERWKCLLTGCAMEMAQAMKIPWDQFRWYAAFHDESHHPHVHMVCYSADGKSGYLTKDGIAQIKSNLAGEIFRQDLTELYRQQTQRRDALNQDAQAVMRELILRMEEGAADNPRIGELMTHLADRLRFTSGKKQYGYLKAPLKSVVDEIVDELARDPRVAQAYELWYEMREEAGRAAAGVPPGGSWGGRAAGTGRRRPSAGAGGRLGGRTPSRQRGASRLMETGVPARAGHPQRPKRRTGADGPGGGTADPGGGAWKQLRRFHVGAAVSLRDGTAP